MRERQGRGKRLARLIILIFIVFLFWHFFVNKPNPKKITINPSPTPTSFSNCPTENFQDNSALKQVVNSQLTGTHGKYAVVVKNLKTGESFAQNQNQIFDTASLYKLWIMTTVYNQISEGKLTLDQKLIANYADLNKDFGIDPSVAEKTSGTLNTTVQDALTQMITISDNYSALILSKQIGLSNVQDFLNKNCFTQSKVGLDGSSPTTSAYDIYLFYEKLYLGKLADSKETNAMINLLKQQKFTDKIPKYLPYTVQLSIAHKTGELDPYSHDAGIIYTPQGNYILVVMSQSDSRDQANERIANVSNSIYGYFNNEAQK